MAALVCGAGACLSAGDFKISLSELVIASIEADITAFEEPAANAVAVEIGLNAAIVSMIAGEPQNPHRFRRGRPFAGARARAAVRSVHAAQAPDAGNRP